MLDKKTGISGLAALPLVCAGEAQCLAVAAFIVEPVELLHQFRCQLDAVRVDGEAAGVDAAAAGDHVQVAAGGPGKEDGTPFVLQLFETAESAVGTEGFPLFGIDGLW